MRIDLSTLTPAKKDALLEILLSGADLPVSEIAAGGFTRKPKGFARKAAAKPKRGAGLNPADFVEVHEDDLEGLSLDEDQVLYFNRHFCKSDRIVGAIGAAGLAAKNVAGCLGWAGMRFPTAEGKQLLAELKDFFGDQVKS